MRPLYDPIISGFLCLLNKTHPILPNVRELEYKARDMPTVHIANLLFGQSLQVVKLDCKQLEDLVGFASSFTFLPLTSPNLQTLRLSCDKAIVLDCLEEVVSTLR